MCGFVWTWVIKPSDTLSLMPHFNSETSVQVKVKVFLTASTTAQLLATSVNAIATVSKTIGPHPPSPGITFSLKFGPFLFFIFYPLRLACPLPTCQICPFFRATSWLQSKSLKSNLKSQPTFTKPGLPKANQTPAPMEIPPEDNQVQSPQLLLKYRVKS